MLFIADYKSLMNWLIQYLVEQNYEIKKNNLSLRN